MFSDLKARGDLVFEDQYIELDFNKDILQLVADLIFRKAQKEHFYSGVYAKLCG